jgi:predicted nuclease of predicted toxin-antitoxin system
MKFLVDNQLPVALAGWLLANGEQVDHVLDLDLERAGDSEIWALCIAEDRIVVSKDVDFLLLANRPGDTGRLLWVRMGNCRTSALLARFAAAWPAIQSAFASGQRVVELR